MSQSGAQRSRSLPKAQVIHHLPGRLRLRLPEGKGDPAFLEHLKLSISTVVGVNQVDVSPITGSILIQYDESAQPELSKRLANPNVIVELQVSHAADSAGPKPFKKFVRELSENIKRESGDAIDLKELFPLSIAAYDLFFVKRSKPTPLWLTLLMFAFSSYMDLNRVDPHQRLDESMEALRLEIAALRKEVQASRNNES